MSKKKNDEADTLDLTEDMPQAPQEPEQESEAPKPKRNVKYGLDVK